MTDDDKQAVVEETDAQAAPAAEETDARDDGDNLDELLAEYGQGQEETAVSTPEQTSGEGENLKEQLQKLSELVTTNQHQQDMGKAIESVRGDMDADFFDDDLVESWIDGQARKEPKLRTAWVNRHNDPAGFNRVLGGLNKRFAKKFAKMPDAAATEDREAVADAVRGNAGKAPEGGDVPDFAGMTDGEARAEMKKMGIKNPGF